MSTLRAVGCRYREDRATLPIALTYRCGRADGDSAHPRNGHVFSTGKSHVTYKTTLGAFRLAAKRASIRDVRLHDLRRTLMTRATAAGVSAHVLRDLLGHRTATMAHRYVCRAGTAVADATERMGADMAALMRGTKLTK